MPSLVGSFSKPYGDSVVFSCFLFFLVSVPYDYDSDWRIFFSPLDILALFVSVFGFIQMYYRTMIFEALNTLTDLPGTLTVEQIYQDRDKFASLVREVAAPDVGRMGIEILSFTIKV